MTNFSSPATRARIIAYGAILSAVYVAYGAVSAIGPLQVLHGVDVHFVRALLLVVGAARVRKYGTPTVMGFVSALLFAPALSGAVPPDFLLLIPATFAAGLTYDLALKFGDYAKNAIAIKRIFAATLISSLAESIIVTAGLMVIAPGVIQSAGLTALTGLTPPLAVVIFFLLGRNILASVIGAETGEILLNRFSRKPALQA